MREEADAQQIAVSISWQAAQSSSTDNAKTDVLRLESSRPEEELEHVMTGSAAAWRRGKPWPITG